MAALNAIPRDALSPAERENYDIYKPQIAALIASQKFRDYEMPANSDSTFWTDIGYTARRPFPHLGRLSQLDRADARHSALFPRTDRRDARRAEARLYAARRDSQGPDGSITAVTDAAPEKNLFYTPFIEMPGIADADKAALRAEAVAAIRDTVQPAYRELLAFMRDEYLPGRTRTTLAAQDMPDGKGVVSRADPGIHHARHGPGGDSCARPARSRQPASADGRRDDTDGLDRRLPGLPALSAHRSAVLRQDPSGIADAGGVDRQDVRRQGLDLVRLSAAHALRHRAGAGRPRAVLHLRPRRPGPVPRQHLQARDRPLLQSDRDDAA